MRIYLSIFGLPLTPTMTRPVDEEEPFDITIEDLEHPDGVPKTWLRCGVYCKNDEQLTEMDMYIDTETEKVYGCLRKKYELIDTWDDFDTCLCDIINSCLDVKEEYRIKI